MGYGNLKIALGLQLGIFLKPISISKNQAPNIELDCNSLYCLLKGNETQTMSEEDRTTITF